MCPYPGDYTVAAAGSALLLHARFLLARCCRLLLLLQPLLSLLPASWGTPAFWNTLSLALMVRGLAAVFTAVGVSALRVTMLPTAADAS
jgi:hypothetical protein